MAKVVFTFYTAAAGGICVFLFILSMFIVSSASQTVTGWWLSYWSDHMEEHSQMWFLGFYALLTVVSLVVTISLRMVFAKASVRAARVVHESLIKTVLRAPMSFFDTTPLGRILNRVSQDQNTVDSSLPDSISSLFSTLCSIVNTLIVISAVTPLFLLLIVPLAAVYAFTQRFYVATSRELKRLESVSKSPVYAHFSETLNGTVSIRAYRDQSRYVHVNGNRLDTSQSSYFMGTVANRWLAVRLELIGACIVTGSILFCIVGRKTIDPSLAGLAIANALSVTQTLNWMVRQSAEVESKIVSVERLREYSFLPVEPHTAASVTVPSSWPSQGAISIRDLKLKYRVGCPYVLNGISLDIRAHEKIGICGRTGAGKSSLLSALYRLADVQEGSITIDGVSIADVSLDRLRSSLAIIPQEPTLFSGTMRKSLDPLGQFSDEDIWAALDLVSLKSVLEARPEGLNSPVVEGGENWSHGQRQLICMARAVLRRCRIVVLDEATAACDVETDALLQRTIRTVFRDCTVLTIAHRVNTIIDADRVACLHQGVVVEFDTPAALLANPSSMFASLVRESAMM